MFTEKVFTLEEVSDHLRIPVQALQKEIDSGRLPAANLQGFVRIRETDLALYKNDVFAGNRSDVKSEGSIQLTPAPDFTYTWPNKKIEQFTEVREGLASYKGKEHHVKLGFTLRSSAGKRRRRCLVLVDRYATVEFVSGNEKSEGKIASIIKDRDGKQLPVGATLPPEYQGISVGPYRDVVIGSGASNGLAVVCEGNDFNTMTKHALLRYQFRKDRK